MTEQPAPRRRLTERLGFRLALFLSLALLPVGLVAVFQATDITREARARAEAALAGQTLRASIPELRLTQQMEGAAAALSISILPLLDDMDACSATMKTVLDTSQHYSFVSFYDTDGISDCSSAGRRFDFSASPILADVLENPSPRLDINRDAPASGTSVLFATHPVYGDDGTLIGFVSISVPHDELAAISTVAETEGVLALMTFDGTGELLTASGGLDSADGKLPRDRPLSSFVGNRSTAFTALSARGDERVFSVVPIVSGKLYVLGTMPAERTAFTLFQAAPLIAFPAIMWLVSLVVAWAATEHLVSRHIRKLRRSITMFASGKREVSDLNLDSAPWEIRDVAASFERMTDTILHDEAELENGLHQKEVLLREVHHRVKNNLQLIASIVNMQIRQAKAAEAKSLLKGLQSRVMSLATIHRELYQTSGQVDIRADELLADIVRQVLAMGTGPGKRFKTKTSFDDIHLVPDQAVPLALLLTEVLTNALKYASGDGEAPSQLEVTLRRLGDQRAVFEIRNSVGHAPQAEDDMPVEVSTGLGTQLVQAFAQQLGGAVEREVGSDQYTVRVAFDLTPLDEAEERAATEFKMTSGV